VILPYEPGYTGHREMEKRRKETKEWLRQREQQVRDRTNSPPIVPQSEAVVVTEPEVPHPLRPPQLGASPIVTYATSFPCSSVTETRKALIAPVFPKLAGNFSSVSPRGFEARAVLPPHPYTCCRL
jgi:hypothetical protein